MGIESRGSIEKYKIIESLSIEGEAMIAPKEIIIDDSEYMDLPAQITWSDSSLVFKRINKTYSFTYRGFPERVSLYEAVFEFIDLKGEPKQINLTDTTSRKPCYFIGSRNGFYAQDPEMNNHKGDFYAIGIMPWLLESNQKYMSVIDHELGHAILCHENADRDLLQAGVARKAKYLPNYAGIIEYAAVLAGVIPDSLKAQNALEIDRRMLGESMSKYPPIDHRIRLFHERYAWAAGLHLQRQRQSSNGFKNPLSVFEFVNFSLSSYARGFNDERFLKGVKPGYQNGRKIFTQKLLF